jgi:hypothetical protein
LQSVSLDDAPYVVSENASYADTGTGKAIELSQRGGIELPAYSICTLTKKLDKGK